MASIERLTRWALADYVAEHGLPCVGEVIVLDLGFGAAVSEYVVTNNNNDSCFNHMANLSIKNTEPGSMLPAFLSVYSDPAHPNNRRPPVCDRRLG